MEEREGRKSRLIPQSEALAGAVGLPIQEAEAGAIPVEPVVPTANPTPAGGGGGSYNSGTDQTNTAGANDGARARSHHGPDSPSLRTQLHHSSFNHREPIHRNGGGRDRCNRFGRQLYLRLVSSYFARLIRGHTGSDCHFIFSKRVMDLQTNPSSPERQRFESRPRPLPRRPNPPN